MDKVICKQHIITVLSIPRDGNCLFSAIAHQLTKEKPGSSQHKTKMEELRIEVADHIEDNPQKFQEQIASNLSELNTPHTRPNINKERITDRISDYCKKLRTPGFWGGAESITAISKIYKVSIDIFMEEGDLININAHEISDKKLKLAYRKGSIGYNHYDSVIDIQALKENTNKATTHSNIKLVSQVNIENINIAQSTGFEVQLNDNTSSRRKKTSLNIKIATWNVRGCTHPQKKSDIDETLNDNGIDIAAIQETHTSSGNVETENYIWWTASKSSEREYRGVAILINKASTVELINIRASYESICSAKIQWGNTILIVIAAHIFSENDARYKEQLSELSRTVAVIHNKYPILILGDLNAHFGEEDNTPEDKRWIGGRLGHLKTNEIGRYLKTLMNTHSFTLHNSWSQRNTVLNTWSNGHSSSQIDHILSTLNRDAIKYINAKWTQQVKTDHKLLYGIILKDKIKPPNNPKTSEPPKKKKRRRWHVQALNTTETKHQYAAEIQIAIEEMNLKDEHPTTLNEEWKEIKEIITNAASSILTEPRSPMTPKEEKPPQM